MRAEGVAPRIRQGRGAGGATGAERPFEAAFGIGDAEAGLPEVHFPQVEVRARERETRDIKAVCEAYVRSPPSQGC